MAPLSILVIGNGIAGPTLASFLLLAPTTPDQLPHITILERSARPRSQGQNIDIRGAGAQVMRKLGLECTVRASLTNEIGVKIVDEKDRGWGSHEADQSGKVQTGTSDLEILRGRLADICYQRCDSISRDVQAKGGKGVDFVFGDYTERVDQDGQKVHVTFAKSRETKSYDLVVGADGLQSRTRAMVWGEDSEEERIRRLGMYGAYFSMPSQPSDGKWRRWFHAPGKRGIMVRPGETPDRSTVSINIMPENQDRFKEVATDGRKGIEAQKALIKEYFDGEGWECERILEEMSNADDFYYSMVAQVLMHRWSKGRVVLLGDAGYCASPISGMGTTLGFTGAYNLAGALVQHPNDLNAAFAQYEEKMRPTVEKAQKLSPAFRIMCPETAWGIWAMRSFNLFIYWTGLATLMFKLLGPPANEVPLEEYGFPTLEDWKGYCR